MPSFVQVVGQPNVYSLKNDHPIGLNPAGLLGIVRLEIACKEQNAKTKRDMLVLAYHALCGRLVYWVNVSENFPFYVHRGNRQ